MNKVKIDYDMRGSGRWRGSAVIDVANALVVYWVWIEPDGDLQIWTTGGDPEKTHKIKCAGWVEAKAEAERYVMGEYLRYLKAERQILKVKLGAVEEQIVVAELASRKPEKVAQ